MRPRLRGKPGKWGVRKSKEKVRVKCVKFAKKAYNRRKTKYPLG